MRQCHQVHQVHQVHQARSPVTRSPVSFPECCFRVVCQLVASRRVAGASFSHHYSFCILQSTKQFPTMIRTTTFVLLGLLAAVAGAFVPSAGPSFGKSLLRVSEFDGLVGHRCGFAARCFCTFMYVGMLPRALTIPKLTYSLASFSCAASLNIVLCGRIRWGLTAR